MSNEKSIVFNIVREKALLKNILVQSLDFEKNLK
jgi:hypothetical protein